MLSVSEDGLIDVYSRAVTRRVVDKFGLDAIGGSGTCTSFELDKTVLW